MDLFINGMGCISPQKTFGEDMFWDKLITYETNRMQCVNPDYTALFDPKAIRRMSRILKFGGAAAKIALDNAGNPELDLISTGTGFGCLEDSEIFLKNITEGNEGVVSPTAFIQSTHNTVSAQIALLLKCYKPNNTFSHRGFSFESALLDAKLNASDNKYEKNFLVGSYDESSPYSYAIQSRMNTYRKEPCNNLELFKEPGQGVLAGEGAAFFVLGKEKKHEHSCRFSDVETILNPLDAAYLQKRLIAFLAKNKLEIADIHIVLSGLNGDRKRDALLNELNGTTFTNQILLGFKHLSGEYITASSFAMWLGAEILKTQAIPTVLYLRESNERWTKNVLICNAYKNNYTFILLQQ